MAKGIGTGLIHGGLASGAVLLLLSLTFPVAIEDAGKPNPELPEAVAPDVAAPEVSPEEAAPDDPATEEAAPDTAAPKPAADTPPPPESASSSASEPAAESAAAPQASAIDLPVGSEFARGPDLAPPSPQIPDAPEGLGGLTEAPAVAAPTAEPGPVTSAAPVQLADPSADSTPALGGLEQPEDASDVQVIGMRAVEAPALPGAPVGLGAVEGAAAAVPDSGPRLTSPVPAEVAAASEPAPEPEPQPAPETAPEPEPLVEPATETPSLAQHVAPAPDLSTPPDLADLGALERN